MADARQGNLNEIDHVQSQLKITKDAIDQLTEELNAITEHDALLK